MFKKYASLKVRQKKLICISLFTLIIGLFPLYVSNAYYRHQMILILWYAYIATAWNIVGGYAGQVSMGHAAFLTIGGYITTLFYNYANLTPWVGMLIGAVVAAFMAFLLGIPSFRLKGSYFSISTIAFAEALCLALNTYKYFFGFKIGGAEGMSVSSRMGRGLIAMNFRGKVEYFYIIYIMLAILLFLVWKMEKSRLGYYFVALREDEDAAKALGINTQRTKLIAAAMSAFFVGIGGAFWGMLVRYFDPATICGITMSTQMVFLAVVGGKGTIMGPTLGAVLLVTFSTVAQTYFGSTTSGIHLIIYGIAVVLTILLMPSGQGLIHLVTRWLGIDEEAENAEKLREQAECENISGEESAG
jgi:branched-chain amino acid transport system permease protein